MNKFHKKEFEKFWGPSLSLLCSVMPLALMKLPIHFIVNRYGLAQLIDYGNNVEERFQRLYVFEVSSEEE